MGVPEDDSVQVTIDPSECDLQEAEYDVRLSSAGRDDGRQLVYTTVDRVAFRAAPEIVDTVLDANGFALNLENVLAALDDLKIGYRVRMAKRQPSADETPVAESYVPALTLRLPTKNRVGPLLAKFYAEVDAYQAELARLREERGRAQGGQRKEVDKLRRERDELAEQNKLLQQKLDDMTRELNLVKKAHADAAKALAAQHLLPAQVRTATVHEVDLTSRYVALKSGRKVFSVPLVALWVYPKAEDPCLVSIQDGEVIGVFFHEGAQSPPGTVLAEVLHVASGKVKIREDNRRTRVIDAQNPAEEALINQLRRGHRVLLFLHDNELIRFTPCTTTDPELFARAVQESIARWELSNPKLSDHSAVAAADEDAADAWPAAGPVIAIAANAPDAEPSAPETAPDTPVVYTMDDDEALYAADEEAYVEVDEDAQIAPDDEDTAHGTYDDQIEYADEDGYPSADSDPYVELTDDDLDATDENIEVPSAVSEQASDAEDEELKPDGTGSTQ